MPKRAEAVIVIAVILAIGITLAVMMSRGRGEEDFYYEDDEESYYEDDSWEGDVEEEEGEDDGHEHADTAQVGAVH